MKAIRIIAWTIIGVTSLVGAIELAEQADKFATGNCETVITITDFSRWASQNDQPLDYSNGTWYDSTGKTLGTAPTEDSDICVK